MNARQNHPENRSNRPRLRRSLGIGTILLAGILATTGCEPITSPDVDVTGLWAFEAIDRYGGAARRVRGAIQFEQDARSLRGQYAVEVMNTGSAISGTLVSERRGPIEGSVSGSTVRFKMQVQSRGSAQEYMGTVVGPDLIQGEGWDAVRR